MAGLFSLTAPLTVTGPNGQRRVIAACFRHAEGVLVFELGWHAAESVEGLIHVVPGVVTGEGPWKVGDNVFNVLGCHGSDPALALDWERWQSRITTDPNYPPAPLVAAIARRFGAIPD